MKNLIRFNLVFYFFLLSSSLSAQLIPASEKALKPNRLPSKTLVESRPAQGSSTQKCGFDYLIKKGKQKGYNESQFEAEISRLVAKKFSEGNFTGPVTIPVIFHVLYRNADGLGNSANLSTSYFQAQVAQLNLDYANLSGSPYFGTSADVQIRFCLALVDTAGRPLATPGIDRINAQGRGWSNTNTMGDPDVLINYFESTIKPASYWDPYSYLNVWTAGMNNSGLLGYASFPSLSTLSGLDNLETSPTAGVVIAWQSVGSVATPNPSGGVYDKGRTLTHELGHFFGLRHIWGDSPCGNDYCADTPPQFEATFSCPAAGTLNDCVPSVPKMFENYMDYSDDGCLNTFTANQAARCQVVMDNSPRRLTLISSKACDARPGNAIGFSSAAPQAITETGNAGACPNVKTYSFNIYVSSQATGNATINFTGGGTATLNSDYTISPSSVSYSNLDNSVKTVTVTVVDDQVAEASESIVLGYTITGSGVVAGPDKQIMTIQITDDDIAVVDIDNTAPLKTILSENFNASTNLPAGWTREVYGDGVTTPNSWVISANAGTGFTTNAAHITSNVASSPNSYNIDNESDAYLFTPLIDASALKDIIMSFRWKSDGEVGYDAGYIGYIPEGETVTASNVRYFNTVLNNQPTAVNSSLSLPNSFFANKKFYFVFNWYNDASIGSDPPFTIDDVSFTGKTFSIASTTDADTAFAQYSGQGVNYFSKSTVSPNHSRLIATLNNLTQNVGCITAAVSASGNNLVTLTTNTGVYQRSEKVITLVPASANTSASYSLTLYYTTAELAAWAGAVPNLKVMKVADGVNLSSTLTPSNSQLYTPVVNDQRATKGYVSYTINVTGGFSQFILVSAATTVPVSLLSFNAQPVKTRIDLSWTTSMELNNKGFIVERSINGIEYTKIGWVNGRGTSNEMTSYSFADRFVHPGILYHYRLKQVDIDNREQLSQIRQAKITDGGAEISVSPNPASEQVKLFVRGYRFAKEVCLLNSEGQKVKSWVNLDLQSPVQLSLAGLAKGIYIFNISTQDAVLSKKLIIQ